MIHRLPRDFLLRPLDGTGTAHTHTHIHPGQFTPNPTISPRQFSSSSFAWEFFFSSSSSESSVWLLTDTSIRLFSFTLCDEIFVFFRPPYVVVYIRVSRVGFQNVPSLRRANNKPAGLEIAQRGQLFRGQRKQKEIYKYQKFLLFFFFYLNRNKIAKVIRQNDMLVQLFWDRIYNDMDVCNFHPHHFYLVPSTSSPSYKNPTCGRKTST